MITSQWKNWYRTTVLLGGLLWSGLALADEGLCLCTCEDDYEESLCLQLVANDTGEEESWTCAMAVEYDAKTSSLECESKHGAVCHAIRWTGSAWEKPSREVGHYYCEWYD